MAPRAALIPLLAAVLAAAAPAAEEHALSFRGGPKKVSLLELFSSEGCSSCPPADAWLSTLKTSPGLWRRFVPVVFHVDYWDYLGWKDPLARRAYTARQRRYAAVWGARTVYTPGFALDGLEWRGWGREPPRAEGEPGVLRVRSRGLSRHELRFSPADGERAVELRAHAALLGLGVVSDVEAGENAGRVLRHDFVVLDYQQRVLSGGKATFVLAPRPGIEAQRHAIAAWVTREGSSVPLQAAGGLLR